MLGFIPRAGTCVFFATLRSKFITACQGHRDYLPEVATGSLKDLKVTTIPSTIDESCLPSEQAVGSRFCFPQNQEPLDRVTASKAENLTSLHTDGAVRYVPSARIPGQGTWATDQEHQCISEQNSQHPTQRTQEASRQQPSAFGISLPVDEAHLAAQHARDRRIDRS